MAVYPPHSTHRLQPLDVSLFSPLAIYYSQELDLFLHKSQGLCSLTKRNFFRLFWPAFRKAFTASNVESGWQRTGLYPFKPSVVMDKFKPSRPSSSKSIRSHLTLDNWRKARRLFKEVVTDKYDKRARLLDNMMVNLMAENKILKYRVNGLTEAIHNKKKKRRRGKPLFT